MSEVKKLKIFFFILSIIPLVIIMLADLKRGDITSWHYFFAVCGGFIPFCCGLIFSGIESGKPGMSDNYI